ncbi:MAG: hypothetical protein RLW68_00775 [Devosia marina]|uniref:hypothetical protein n=1 Tax=Devosia marina TaxID=2683198 RepID=UPI0032F07F5B
MDHPSVQHIAIDMTDGVAVMQFITQNDDGTPRSAQDADIEREVVRAGYGGKAWVRVSPEDIPGDRTTRSRWRLRDGRIVVTSA